MLKSSKSTETQSGKDSNTPYYYVHQEEHWRHTWEVGCGIALLAVATDIIRLH